MSHPLSTILQARHRAHQIAKAILLRKLDFEIDMIPLHFEGLEPSKIANWFLTESSVHFKPEKPWGMPAIIQIEPTNRCNLQCEGCPAGGGMERSKGAMDPVLFRKLVDELADYLLVILFWDWGEPFLHPNAYEMIHHAHRAGIKVLSSTNGHVFAEEDHARRVVESGLDALVFSVDGIQQDSYQRYRKTGTLKQVTAGIRNVIAQKRHLCSRTPLVNLRFIIMRHNEHEVDQLDAFAAELEVDAVTIRKFAHWGGVDGLAPTREEHQMPADIREGRVLRNRCRNLWNCPTVHWDGTVCCCFMDYNEDHPLGHLGEQSFRSIWYGEAYREMRRRFKKKWIDLPLCCRCSCGLEGGDVGTQSNIGATYSDDAAARRNGLAGS
jgi:MoaA/NifB/PqqE/SkfB family radical SAM enzyme